MREESWAVKTLVYGYIAAVIVTMIWIFYLALLVFR